jgi:hypothetical protein
LSPPFKLATVISGDVGSIKLTVEIAGLCREDAILTAAREIAGIFSASGNEKYSEPRQT